MNLKIENRNLCAQCGGYCCKKCGCDYFVSDFESMKIDYLETILQEGRTSIVASMLFERLSNGKLINSPILYLRARNINRGEIDLLSFKTTCASLQEDGCYFDFENRPSGGATLIPKVNEYGVYECYSSLDRIKELEKWKPYQKLLNKIVKRHTGMDVYQKIRQDVECLFTDILNKNFEGVAEAELLDVLKMVPLLREVYPEEYKRAKSNANKNNMILVKRNLPKQIKK